MMKEHQIGNEKKIIIAGGGTGGHIFPAIAIANAIKQLEPNSKFLFVGAKGKMEMDKVPQAGYEIVGLDIAGFNRSSLIKNIGLPFKLFKSFFQVARIVKNFKPDAVIGVGGYSTYAVLKYAQLKGIPTFIHEANSYAGKSNTLLSKNATKVFTAIDGMERFFPATKIQITGNPVRSSIAKNLDSRDAAIKHFELDKNKITILSIGGSLGAKNINEAIAGNIELFENNNVQLIWQTGKTFLAQAKSIAEGRKNIFVTDFISDMNLAYAAADVVISRSGAMSIAELSLVGKPTIFVPFPFAAEDHQKVNAQRLVEKNAAYMIEDKEAVLKLVPAVIELSKDQNKLTTLTNNIKKFGVLNADIEIAEAILKSIQ